VEKDRALIFYLKKSSPQTFFLGIVEGLCSERFWCLGFVSWGSIVGAINFQHAEPEVGALGSVVGGFGMCSALSLSPH
jgi:hypothetical protein